MHDISEDYVGMSCKYFTVFKRLCGNDAASNVVLVTTKWAQVDESVGREREQELAELYWKQMLDRGSRVDRFKHSYESAWDIIAPIVEKDALDYIQIQRELVDLRKRLPDTDAGRALRGDLKEIFEEQMTLAQALQDSQDRAPELEAMYNESVERMRSILAKIQQLRVPLGRRVATFFGFR